MKRAACSVAVVAAVLVLGSCSATDYGCGDDDRPKSPRAAGTRLPVPVPLQSQPSGIIGGKEIEAALPPEQARPSLMDHLMRGLMADTLSMAGVIGEIRPGECGKAVVVKGEGATYRCTVFYEGFEAVWKAQFSDVDSGGGWTTAQYRAWPVTGVLTAEAVYAASGRNTEKDQQPRCDRMPRIFRAEAGKATGYKCQILLSRCSSGTWRFRWSDRSVWINDEGRVGFRELGPG